MRPRAIKFIMMTALISFLVASPAIAFNWEECRKIYELQLFGMTTSSGQYTSSTGRCAAIGMNSKKEEILAFVAVNSDSLSEDLARKSGEHLNTLQHLANLTASQTNKLAAKPEAQKALAAERYEDFYELMVRL